MMEMRWDSTFHNVIGSTKHNWLVLKNIFRCLQGIKHLVLNFQFHTNVNTDIIGYIDQIPHYVRSLTSLVFVLGVVALSWRVFETDLMATSTNHYLNDNVSYVARMQTGYIINNITILHILQVKSWDRFVHQVSTNFYVPKMCSWKCQLL